MTAAQCPARFRLLFALAPLVPLNVEGRWCVTSSHLNIQNVHEVFNSIVARKIHDVE